MNAVQKDKEAQRQLLEQKNQKNIDNQFKNMEEGKYIPPTDVDNDPYVEKLDQRITKAQDWNEQSNNRMNYIKASENGLTFGGKRTRRKRRTKRTKRRKSTKRRRR
jgi:hypothetical protein